MDSSAGVTGADGNGEGAGEGGGERETCSDDTSSCALAGEGGAALSRVCSLIVSAFKPFNRNEIRLK